MYQKYIKSYSSLNSVSYCLYTFSIFKISKISKQFIMKKKEIVLRKINPIFKILTIIKKMPKNV